MGFVWPHITIFIIAVLIGWSFLVLGIFDVISSLRNHHLPYWWMYLIRGVLAIAIGFLCIRHPGGTLTTIIVMLGIIAILFGVVEIIGAISGVTPPGTGRRTSAVCLPERTATTLRWCD